MGFRLVSQGRAFAAAGGVLDGGVGVAVPRRCVGMAGAAGIEPTTLGLEDRTRSHAPVWIQSVKSDRMPLSRIETRNLGTSMHHSMHLIS